MANQNEIYLSAGKWLAGVLLTINIGIGSVAFSMLSHLDEQIDSLDSRIDSIERSIVHIETIMQERANHGV